MTKKARNILSLDAKEAMDFFMKSPQYHGFELPEYFLFDPLLDSVRNAVGDMPYEKCLAKGQSPEQLADVNLDILLNKDGRYAVRPIVLANPFLYYFLVREVCQDKSWNEIKALFEKFRVPHLTSCALPVLPREKEPFYQSTAILNWWNELEQRSIELSLEYRYMFMTDITNCYGSVNPQAFDWAFSLLGTEYETKEQSPVAANIQRYLRALQHGRNIGIPQGSAIFDFIAEIILGYSDLLLHKAIKDKGVKADYEIIRYRDDYRVFCNDKGALEDISYLLQHVLEKLNFRMNSKKTKISESIVTDSVKPDKLDYIYNTPVTTRATTQFDSFEKHLLFILMFAREHPDSGSVKTLLSDIDRRIEAYLKEQAERQKQKWVEVDLIDESAETGRLEPSSGNGQSANDKENALQKLKPYKPRPFIPGGSVRAMSAICAQIAMENVGCSHYALRVMSRLVDTLRDGREKKDIIDKTYAKLCHQRNSTYNQLWLQNITYQTDLKAGRSPYTMPLCRLVAGDKRATLWNNKWLRLKLQKSISLASIVDKDRLKKLTPVITFRETRAYNEM